MLGIRCIAGAVVMFLVVRVEVPETQKKEGKFVSQVFHRYSKGLGWKSLHRYQYIVDPYVFAIIKVGDESYSEVGLEILGVSCCIRVVQPSVLSASAQVSNEIVLPS